MTKAVQALMRLRWTAGAVRDLENIVDHLLEDARTMHQPVAFYLRGCCWAKNIPIEGVQERKLERESS